MTKKNSTFVGTVYDNEFSIIHHYRTALVWNPNHLIMLFLLGALLALTNAADKMLQTCSQILPVIENTCDY